MFLRFVSKLVALATLSLTGQLFASPASPTSTGWEKVAVGDSVTGVWTSRILAASENELVLTVGGKIALIDVQTGVQRMLVARPADVNSASQFAMSGGFVNGKLVIISPGFLSLRLDELDTTTGTWGRSASLPTPYVNEVEAPILFNGEIRIQGTDYKIYRCSAIDWSPLPTLSVDGDISPLSSTIGDSYLTGYSTTANPGLRIEKPNGQKRNLPLPAFFGSVVFACSQSYFVANDWENFFIWDARNLELPPQAFPIPDHATGTSSIWRDRYLMIPVTHYQEISILVWDLAHPQRTPGRIALPADAGHPKIHASARNLWFTASGTLGRLAIGDTSQLNVVTLAGARASEHDGTLIFRIKATPPPRTPITIELATMSGSAKAGEDFEAYSGTLTLTSAVPSGEISVRIIPDLKLENYETMDLTIKSVTNGLCFEREATGVIVGTEMAETIKTDPLPGENSFVNIAWLQKGLVARENYSGNVYYCANGQRSWKRITAIPNRTGWGSMKLMPGPKNHLFVVDGDEDSIRKWVEIDVYRDLRLPQGEAPYSTPADRRVAIDENFYLILVEKLGYPGRVELRRYADSSLVRELSLPLGIGSEISLLGGEEGISLIKGAGGTYFHQLTDDGSDAYRFGATTGEVLALHPGYLAVTQSNSNPTELWDTARPVKLATIGQSYLLGEGRVAANPVAPVAAIADYMGVIHQFALAPKVPVILKRTFKGSEAAADVSFNVGFSEATEHPVSVSVSWCSSPADIRIDPSPAILRPGQRNITLPFKLNDDRVAEGEETVRVAISVSGNGQTEEFDVDVTIQDNDIIEFDTKVRDSEIILSSALDMAAGSPVFGFAPRAVVDPVTEKMFQLDEAEDNEIFAHTLVGNEQYVIVGSPGTRGTAHNSFYIVDRKEKSITKRVTRSGTDTGFGSVLHLRGNQVFVGAPGDSAVGTVFAYRIPGGEFLRGFNQPGKKKIGTRFGISIVGDGKSVWIGAPREGTGAVYQFTADTGKLVNKFEAPTPSASNFGHSLAFCGDYLAVGAPSRNLASAVFIYKRSTGAHISTIPSPFKEGGCFGSSLAGMSAARLAIGCPERPGSYSGGIMIHDLRAKPFPLIVMLVPSQKANKYHSERVGTVGKTGSLSAYGSFLGIQFMHYSTSLTVYNGRLPGGSFSEVVHIASIFTPQPEEGSASASITPSPSASSPASSENFLFGTAGLAVSSDGLIATLSLPLPSLAGPSRYLVLEASENLATWKDIATTAGGLSRWSPLIDDAIIDPGKLELKLPAAASGKCYFRLRMENHGAGQF